MKINKIINLILALSLILTMSACAGEGGDETTKAPETTKTPETTNIPETSKEPETSKTPETTLAPETTNVPETTKSPETSEPSASPDTTKPIEPSSSAPETESESPPESTETEAPSINYMEIDLSQYITLGQYKGLEIEIEKKQVVDAEYIEKVLKSDLIYYGYSREVTDRAVTKDDTVSISFVGLLDGVPFEGGTGDQDDFTIYDGGGFIDGFADGLIGAMPGVEVDVNVTFPENYHSAELAGKDVVFKVTVHQIYEAEELDDKIANEMTGGEFKTAAELLAYYEEVLTEQVEYEYNEQKIALTWAAIEKNATMVKAPDDIVDPFFEAELDYYKQMAEAYDMELDILLQYYGYTQESLKQAITDSVIENIVMFSVIKAENLTLSEEEYYKFIEDAGYTEEELLETYTKEKLKESILLTMVYENAPEWQTFKDIEGQ